MTNDTHDDKVRSGASRRRSATIPLSSTLTTPLSERKRTKTVRALKEQVEWWRAIAIAMVVVLVISTWSYAVQLRDLSAEVKRLRIEAGDGK